MTVTSTGPVALLKAAVMTGADELRGCVAAGVELDAARADTPRVRLAGAAAVLEELGRWWPGGATLVDWSEEVFPEGALVAVEWLDGGGRLSRLGLVVRWAGGPRPIERLWAWEERPRPAAAATPAGVPEEVLARLGGGARREPLDRWGRDRVVLGDGSELIARRVLPDGGWAGRATRGWAGRGTALLPYERLPAAVVRVEEDPRGGWWLLRRGGEADGAGEPLAELRAMHAAFAGGAPPPGLCSLEARLALCAPAVAVAERGGVDRVPKQLEAGWECFAALAPDLAEPVATLLADPGPLAARLRAGAAETLLHGAARPELTVALDGRPVLLRWDLATWGPAAVEGAARLAGTLPDAGEAARWLGTGSSAPAAMLAGLLMGGWRLALDAVVHPDPVARDRARRGLDWWAAGARPALGG